MSRFVIAFALLTLGGLVLALPAEACHLFSIWRFPTPQHCAVARPIRIVQRDAEAPEPPLKAVILPVVESPAPPLDERTPEQIRDAAEHDAAVAKYHDYLNAQIQLLHELRGTQ